MITIVSAQEGDLLEHVITLAHEYVTWMVAEIGTNYPELDLAEFTFEHDYDDIRQKFPGEHVPPDGCLLIVKDGDHIMGCIAVGRLSDTICEIRTLFVRPSARGAGAGRKLVEASLNEARKLGYERARLDMLGFMEGAQKLYRSFGFEDITPYRELSESLQQYIHFMELKFSD